MAISYPASLDGTLQFGQPSGTSLLTSPDHAVLHDNLSILGTTLETLLGTTSGSNYLGTVAAHQTQLGTYVVNATPTANNILVADASALLPIAAVPTGVLGYAQSTSSFTTTTASSSVDVTSLSTTVTVPAGGRKIKITAFIGILDCSAAGIKSLYLQIMESSTVLASSAINYGVATSTYNFPQIAIALLTPSAGSHTYKVDVLQDSAGTITATNSATVPAFILVEQL